MKRTISGLAFVRMLQIKLFRLIKMEKNLNNERSILKISMEKAQKNEKKESLERQKMKRKNVFGRRNSQKNSRQLTSRLCLNTEERLSSRRLRKRQLQLKL